MPSGAPRLFSFLWVVTRKERVKKGSNKETAAQVMALAEQVVQADGYELVEVDIVPGRPDAILRLTIDTIPPGTAEHAVGVADCSKVSRVVSDLLDVEDVMPGTYRLEVSSPGLFRPLTKPQHFDVVVGERVKVKTYEKRDNRRVFTGTLTGRNGDVIHVDVDGTDYALPLEAVAKANLEPNLDV